MHRNSYYKLGRSKNLWENFRKSRNEATRLRSISMTTYFDKRCNSTVKTDSKTFWDTARPFMTDKKTRSSDPITLNLNGNIVNDPVIISNSFNSYFSTVANHIGNSQSLMSYNSFMDITDQYENHESIIAINRMMQNSDQGPFNFHSVSESDVSKLIKNIDKKKATGYDGISPKLLRIAVNELAFPITNMINKSIEHSHFPDGCKHSEISPQYKKNDNLVRGNYRPVSILPSISKLYERTYYDQMYEYMKNILSHFLAAYRKSYSCQHVLLKFLEDIRVALDNRRHFGALLSDLSKAFDCIPHALLLCKLRAYGFSDEACKLVFSYLRGRRQRVKVGNARSEWCFMSKGVPQGSILGPLLFNVFLNDLFYFLTDLCTLYNYADDNNLGYSHPDINELINRLKECGNIAIHWFEINEMEANPGKFQALIKTYGNIDLPPVIEIADVGIEFSDSVKLLGVNIDSDLSFNTHVSAISKKSSYSLHAVTRLSRYFSVTCRRYLYNAFIIANFSYCSIVWHNCGIQNIIKLEKINRRALRIVFDDHESSYSHLLLMAGQHNLYTIRRNTIALEVFKCIRKLNPPFLHDTFQSQHHHYDTRQFDQLEPPITRTNSYGTLSFRFEGAKIWNSLPIEIKCSETIETFKSALRALPPLMCNCNMNACVICIISKL